LPNYRLLIEYDGRSFKGWQRQKNTSDTIQEKIENAIRTITRNATVSLTVAGRTDAGVSAENQVANFHIETELTGNDFIYCVNSLLPKEITIKDVIKTDEYFHARYSAIGRQYSYRCTTIRRSIDCDYYYLVKHDPDIGKMNYFIDSISNFNFFKSFCKNKEDKRNFECNIRTFSLESKPECHELLFTISADRFLHSMIRALIGCTLDISRGRFDADEIMAGAIKGEQLKIYYLPSTPLILNKIFYRDE